MNTMSTSGLKSHQSNDESIVFDHANSESSFVFNSSDLSLNNNTAVSSTYDSNSQNSIKTDCQSPDEKFSRPNAETFPVNECNDNNNDKKACHESIFNLHFAMDSANKEEIVQESILMAISQMSLCEVPLKQRVYEALIQENQQNHPINRALMFREYTKIEKSKTLFPIEHEKLEELRDACVLLRNQYKQIVNETNHLPDAIQLTEAAICRLIRMSNRLPSFNRLDQSDRISLLKHSIIEMFCIRATTNFHMENDFWLFIDDKKKGLSMVSMEVLKAAQINFMSHKNFAIKFNAQFRHDAMIADLLTIIILFRPSRAIVSNIEIVSEEFLNYCYLLRRYLQVKYEGNSCLAKNAFITLMHRLEELYHLSEDIVHLYLDLNPQNAGQLFVELFDLKR